MGKFIQIRVMARTYRPEDVEKAWPRLWALAWPDERLGPGESKGVLDMVGALDDQMRFGEIDPQAKKVLESGIPRARGIREKLENALAEREPRLADDLSYELEELLGELDKRLPKS